MTTDVMVDYEESIALIQEKLKAYRKRDGYVGAYIMGHSDGYESACLDAIAVLQRKRP